LRGVDPLRVAVVVTAGLLTTFATPGGAGGSNGVDPIGLRIVLDEGEIVIALDRAAAPDTVQTILELVEPDARADAETGGYYDGLTLNHTWPHVELGTGVRNDDPITIPQEIDGGSLGLDREHITRSNEAMNLWQFEFAEANERWKAQGSRPEVFETWLNTFKETDSVDFLMEVSRQEINEVLGYRYVSGRQSLRARHGHVYLKPVSPVDNSPALRILLADRPQLDGRVTVIGRVVSGLELAHELSVCELKNFRHRPIYEPVDPVVISRVEAVELTAGVTEADPGGDAEMSSEDPTKSSRSRQPTESANQPHDAVESEGGIR
jgi:cyclophilin family peptidyl-prolyl cis-trans isomerase